MQHRFIASCMRDMVLRHFVEYKVRQIKGVSIRETRSEIRSVMATPGFAPLCCVILGDSTPLSELHRTAIETEGIKYVMLPSAWLSLISS